MPKDDKQKYFDSDSNLFLYLDDPEWFKDLNKNIGQYLKKIRRTHKLSYARCSKITGIPVEQIKRYENGEETISIFHLWNYGEIDDYTIEEVLYGLSPYFRNCKYDDEYY